MKIYTLRNKMHEFGSTLNGKLLTINTSLGNDGEQHVDISDAETGEKIIGGSVENMTQTDDGIIVSTAAGNRYDLMTVRLLIPTTDEVLKIIDRRIESQPASAHGDGYSRAFYTFNRDITQQEFMDVLKEFHSPIMDRSDTLRRFPEYGKIIPYSVINGYGNQWIYTLVIPKESATVQMSAANSCETDGFSWYINAREQKE